MRKELKCFDSPAYLRKLKEKVNELVIGDDISLADLLPMIADVDSSLVTFIESILRPLDAHDPALANEIRERLSDNSQRTADDFHKHMDAMDKCLEKDDEEKPCALMN